MELGQRIEAKVLVKLLQKKAFVKGHMLEENILKGIPRSQWGLGKRILHELTKTGLVRVYGKTLHGLAFQLNIHRLAEVEERISKCRSLANEGQSLYNSKS